MSSFSISINRLICKDIDSEQDKEKECSLYNNIISLIKCKICSSVLTDPYDCLCCNNTFCFTCINNSILKLNKCPFDTSISLKDDEFNAFAKLKPSSANILNFLSGLKFKCSFSNKGCNEEICYNSIVLHEIGCIFGRQFDNKRPNSISSHCVIRSNNNESFHQKKLSLMSFNKNDHTSSEHIFNLNENHNFNPTEEKLEKIIEILQHIQFGINSKIIANPSRDFYVNETPKFSMSVNCVKKDNYNYVNNESIDFHDFKTSFNHQQQKILNEVEFIHEKISTIERCVLQNETFIKNIIEEQLCSCFEKLSNFPSTYFSSINNSINSSIFNSKPNKLINSNISNKFEYNTAFKKNHTGKYKIKEKDSHSFVSPSPTKSNSKSNSPRINTLNKNTNKGLKISKELKKITNSTELNFNNSFSLEYIKDNIEDTKVFPFAIYHKLEKIEKNLTEKINSKLGINLNDNIDNIKACFMEITLDSTNLFVQKFDELIKNLKMNSRY